MSSPKSVHVYDAQAFSDRAGSVKKEVGMEDVMMAIQAKATTSFVTPPSQEVGTKSLA